MKMQDYNFRQFRRVVCVAGVMSAVAGMSLAVVAAEPAAPPPTTAISVGAENVLATGGEGIRAEAAVAYGGGAYLAAWREGWHGEGGNARVFLARLDAGGKPAGTPPAALAPNVVGNQERPQLAFAQTPEGGPEGGVFLIVWQQMVADKQYDVLGMRLTAKGEKLDAKPIVVAAAPGNDVLPSVASDGRNFIVAWQGAVETANNTDFCIFTVPVAATGTVGQPTRQFIGHTPMIGWDGKIYLLFGSGRLCLRLDAAGKVIGKKEPESLAWVTVFHSFCSFATGGNGGALMLFDHDVPNYWGWGGKGGITCVRVTGDGKPDPAQVAYDKTCKEGDQALWDDWLEQCKNPPAKDQLWPSGASAVCWDGKQFLAVWQRYHVEQAVMFKQSDLAVSRVDGWKPLDRPGVVLADSEASEQVPAIASDGAGKSLCLYEKVGKDGSVAICARPVTSK
jgi:hypothetical protein